MNKQLLTVFCAVALCLQALSQGHQNQPQGIQAQPQVFPRCILAGDYADPSIMREGKDFYMTHSMFNYNPGFLIWHSQDLVNWEPVCRVATKQLSNAWAPELFKLNGKYYLYYPANKKVWMCTADNIAGPWTTPIEVEGSEGIDPGHIVDDQGNRYLFVHKGRMARLNAEGTALMTPLKTVHKGWDIPKEWVTEGKWPEKYLESPKLIRHNGYYYLTSAEGGTAGPATSHMIVSARAKSLEGPWEESPYNPIVHTYSATDNWWSKGHGTLIDDADGNWWLVYHAYANGYHTLGRQTLLEPVEWTSDGWFRTKATQALPKAEKQIKHGFNLSDDFTSSQLGLQWTFYREYTPKTVRVGGGSLTLQAKGGDAGTARYLLITAEDKGYDVKVDLKSVSTQSGLMLFYNEKAYSGITTDGKNFYLYHKGKLIRATVNKWGKKCTIRLRNLGEKMTAQVSRDGKAWTTLASDMDLSSMNHNELRGFLAVRPGLMAMGKGSATFSHFVYSSHKPDEKNMKAYLMVYHKDEDHGLHMAISYDGRQFKALNNDNPVIAGDSIARQKGIRDPHIYRGPDGAFYLSMTDLHVFGKRDGKRDTEWERPVKEYGWGNNTGLVLMKSWDLIHWTRSNPQFNELFTAWKEIGCAWAPETFYDDKAGRLMLYLTMRQKNEPNKLYYVYVNENYDKIETEPRVLFQYPDEHISAIDGDITKVGDTYHLMYVSHDGQAGIKQATADSPTGPWHYDARWVDAAAVGCEAPHVFKRIGENKWTLMYDIYRQKPMNFGFVETSDFQTFTDLGEFNNGKMRTLNFISPKHGAVVQITAEEAKDLEEYWRSHPRSYAAYKPAYAPNKNNPVIPGYYADPEILYSQKNGKYYLYPTTDGAENWENHDADVYSSSDLKTWKLEGKALDLKNVKWASSRLWAPCIIERKYGDGAKAQYKYFYYFVANGNIGVGVSDNPAGPFKDALGKPLIANPSEGSMRNHIIDPDVFQDPQSGKYYLYWGNAFLAVAELNDDMVSLKEGTTQYVIPRGAAQRAYHYSEGSYVFYRNGKYYFMWSENDTRSTEYRVRYTISDSPVKATRPVERTVVIKKSPEQQVYATGHHSVICKPGTDEWYIVYHRFARPDGVQRGWSAGYYREVCIDRMYFNEDGTIKEVKPTL
ncbi:family 43 glycosylhydrolase [uncultured Prevotella sp.]|uniref:family 43 glycosylhydrolase n=1 Tax=uncultured Prevotella sp. TaxID=159272 RepID=UPI0027E26CD9|nr:family 43 glycosylhydrolase [uncultured Prevotella sp.]